MKHRCLNDDHPTYRKLRLITLQFVGFIWFINGKHYSTCNHHLDVGHFYLPMPLNKTIHSKGVDWCCSLIHTTAEQQTWGHLFFGLGFNMGRSEGFQKWWVRFWRKMLPTSLRKNFRLCKEFFFKIWDGIFWVGKVLNGFGLLVAVSASLLIHSLGVAFPAPLFL